MKRLGEWDIVVAGAGSAGCSAAIAARMVGAARVLLVERYGFLGGTSTGVLDTFYGFFTPGPEPRKVAGGIPDLVVDRLHQMDGAYLRPNTYGAGTGVTYNPEALKLVWDELMEQHGVEVLPHALLVDVRESGGAIRELVLATKLGLAVVSGRRFIDASGDADLCHWAGIESERAGDLDPAQNMTTTFRMSGVDLAAFDAAGGKGMLMQRMKEAMASGRHPLPRAKGSAHAMAIPGLVSTVAVRVAGADALDAGSLASAEREGRRQAFIYERFFRECVPGYEDARICGLSHQIGVRESRRVYGEYRLTREDCLGAARFSDRVLLCGAPIEDHRAGEKGQEETAWAYVPEGKAYDVPYRTLVPRGRDEVWVAGRCFSATHDAHASCRSMAQTMSMGQAAGAAAALSLKQDCGARGLPIGSLQQALADLGAVLETPTTIAATAADAWLSNQRANLGSFSG